MNAKNEVKFQLKFSENKQKVIENMPKQMMQDDDAYNGLLHKIKVVC